MASVHWLEGYEGIKEHKDKRNQIHRNLAKYFHKFSYWSLTRKLKLLMDWKNCPFTNWNLVKQETEAWRLLFREERVNSKYCRGRFWDHFYSESITDDLKEDSDDTRVFEFSPDQLLVCPVVPFMVPSAIALLFLGSPLHHRVYTHKGRPMGEWIVQHKFKELYTHLSQLF